MLELRNAEQRGSANFGWLQSRHSFSFGRYYDPAHMGFSALRVINDDWVAPGAGFDTHGHRDMEIISLVLEGSIAHRDSTGQIATLPAGEYQLMSAGRGIMHSEFNANPDKPLRFLQIWIEPNEAGGEPGYQQKTFAASNGLSLIASPDGVQGSLKIRQHAYLYQLCLAAAGQQAFQAKAGRHVYVHLVSGALQGQSLDHRNGSAQFSLQPGDGIKISDISQWQFNAQADSFALIFDLP